ncbi:GNAT family N-acetyltransferase [Halalkalibacter okhensis]|uniref:N-acetyltransferase domain-containing protein n=1 Tax=Halalkalibacter okhensis TaxID=333138 RepID=A0A0B0IG16_9BACI|nr:GNAT family N-acetyltransferase [Halalkalibacter okhensis]KHF38616.1 hypothetical protein LQ50_20060 [Halalkalibacter okhensis]
MLTEERVLIREVKKEEVPQVIDFVLRVFHEVYPFQLGEASKKQLLKMEEKYLNQKDALFVAAFNQSGEVIGTISVHRYDNRINTLHNRYDLSKTCEISKCYIDKNYRRYGIGTSLFQEAVRFCQTEALYETLYLHTHKFLPGGFPFWKSKGFSIVLDENIETEIVHMEMQL